MIDEPTKPKTNQRKPFEHLVAEIKETKAVSGKTFRHKKSGQYYQLLFVAFDERTNEQLAIYCLLAWTQLKFSRPLAAFLEKFEEAHA